MVDNEEKILKFPEKKVVVVCKACKGEFDEKTIAINLGPLPVIICPNCRCLQIPEEIYNEIVKQNSSNIVTPPTGGIIV